MPVTSALNICMPPEEFSIGSTARVKSMIPIPPIHCISDRHICIPWLRSETVGITDAPVVVNPDIASKYASDMVSLVVLSRNGIIPKIEKTTQTRAVSRNPSRLPISNRRGLTQNAARAPQPSVDAIAIRNAYKSSSP